MKRFFSANPFALNTALLLVRITVGAFLLYHGLELFDASKMNEYLSRELFKDAPTGKLLVYTGKSAELLSGVLLIAGFLTRVASLLIIGTFCFISFVMGNGNVWYNEQHPFLFVVIGFLFLFAGSGTISVDAALFKQRRRY